MADSFRKGSCIITSDGRVLVEYAQNRFIQFNHNSSTVFMSKVNNGMSLKGIYECSRDSLKFELDDNGRLIGAS